MQSALFCPFTLGPTRGNITSVQRIARHLRQLGCQVSLIPLDRPDWAEQLQLLNRACPAILHAFHAYHAGPAARETAHRLKIPYLITLTGSDLFEPALRDHPNTRQAVADAAAITCFDPLVAELAEKTFPRLASRLTVIPQGVEPFPVSVTPDRIDNALVILLPAALRPVKGIDYALEQLAPLAAKLPQLQLWIVGGVLDQDYADRIHAQAAALPWVKFLGERPHQAMGALYASADLVLNSSQFEGGMANALLEAMIVGKPVLARAIAGNRSLIRHGETGWLFEDGQQLRDLVCHLAQQPDQRENVGRAAQNYVGNSFSPEVEATALFQLYTRLVT